MKPKIDLTQAAGSYGAALASMARLTGLNPQKIVDAEAGIVLKTCASRTKVATAEAVRKGARGRALRGLGLTSGNLTVNAGIKAEFGRVWWRNPKTGKWVPVLGPGFAKSNRRINSVAWAEVQDMVAKARTKIGRAVGLAKDSAALARGSWVMIADRLGIKLESVQGGAALSASAIAKARAAKVPGNKQVNNGAGRRDFGPRGYFVTLINRLPYGRKLGLDRLLTVTIGGRAAFFSQAVRKGFNGSLQQTTRLFKGWTTRT